MLVSSQADIFYNPLDDYCIQGLGCLFIFLVGYDTFLCAQVKYNIVT